MREGEYCKKYCDEILQKPPPSMGKIEEVFAGFASVFGFGVMLYFSWSFWSHFEKYRAKYRANTEQKWASFLKYRAQIQCKYSENGIH